MSSPALAAAALTVEPGVDIARRRVERAVDAAWERNDSDPAWHLAEILAFMRTPTAVYIPADKHFTLPMVPGAVRPL